MLTISSDPVMDAPAAVPINRKLTWWEEWSGIAYFVLTVFAFSAILWHWPAARSWAVPILLSLGLFFEVMSVVAGVSTIVTGRFSSGTPGVGLVCYFWAWLSTPSSFLLSTPQSFALLWPTKLLDLAALFIFSLCVHAPFWLYDRKKQPATPPPSGRNV